MTIKERTTIYSFIRVTLQALRELDEAGNQNIRLKATYGLNISSFYSYNELSFTLAEKRHCLFSL